jgi:hypothetical protein
MLAYHMIASLPLEKWSLEEKVQAVEMIWEDICRHEEEFASPAWHEEILRERQQRLAAGEAKFLDWETVKMQLRRELE